MWFCGSIFEKLLFPFDKIDFRKKGSESSWSTDSPDMISWMKMNGTSTVKEWLPQDQTWSSALHNAKISTMYIRAGRRKMIHQRRED